MLQYAARPPPPLLAPSPTGARSRHTITDADTDVYALYAPSMCSPATNHGVHVQLTHLRVGHRGPGLAAPTPGHGWAAGCYSLACPAAHLFQQGSARAAAVLAGLCQVGGRMRKGVDTLVLCWCDAMLLVGMLLCLPFPVPSTAPLQHPSAPSTFAGTCHLSCGWMRCLLPHSPTWQAAAAAEAAEGRTAPSPAVVPLA